MHFYTDAHHAIRDANHDAPMGVAYRRNKGWFLYDVTKGLDPETGTPEFLCLKPGKLPIPMSDEGEQILMALLTRAEITLRQYKP